MGTLIFEGMKVGVLDGDLTISVDEKGKADKNLVLKYFLQCATSLASYSSCKYCFIT